VTELPPIPDLCAERNAAMQLIYQLCREHNLHIAVVATKDRAADGTWNNQPGCATAFGGASDHAPSTADWVHILGALVGAAQQYRTALITAIASDQPRHDQQECFDTLMRVSTSISDEYAAGDSGSIYQRTWRKPRQQEGRAHD
jgi:hypothetical protein